MTDIVTLGTGVLNWSRSERITDRYGAVGLMTEDSLGKDWFAPAEWHPLAKVRGRGRLVATVLATRPSDHIGDLFRGFAPKTPSVDDRIVLGEGEVFYEQESPDMEVVGIRPDDGRDHDWLDPRALYQAHSQTVRLDWEPDNE